MKTHFIFLALMALHLQMIHCVFTENMPNIGACDFDKIHRSGPIIAIVGIEKLPMLYGNFSILNELFTCTTGRFVTIFKNFHANERVLRYDMVSLFSPFQGMTADELRLFVLPANLNRINVSHNNIEHISYGMY